MSVEIDDKRARLLAERHFSVEPVNDWAIKCLEQGFDSPNLRMLASMSGLSYVPSEYDEKLRLAYRELGWDEIPPYVYLLQYARILAQEIVDEKLDPIEGSKEMYKILRDNDEMSELNAWYDIDEMIFSQKYFEKTGEKDHYYRDIPELVSEIRKACSDLLQRTRLSVGSLPETSFEEAEAFFQEFLKDNGHPLPLQWVFAEDILSDAFNVWVRTPLPDNNREFAKKCFELGKQRDFGIAFLSFFTLNGRPCCYIQLPEDDEDAQYKLMGNHAIKFSCRTYMPEAVAVGNVLKWQFKKRFNKNLNWFDDIPTRNTLLPAAYKG